MEIGEHFHTDFVELHQFNDPIANGDSSDIWTHVDLTDCGFLEENGLSGLSVFENDICKREVTAHNPNSCTFNFLECPKCNVSGHLVLQIEAWDGTKRIVINEMASTENLYQTVGEQYEIVAGCWILSTTNNTDGIIARNNDITLLEHKLCSMVLYLVIGTTAYLDYTDSFIPDYLKYLLLNAKIRKVLHGSNYTSPTTPRYLNDCTSPSDSDNCNNYSLPSRLNNSSPSSFHSGNTDTFPSPSYSSLSTFASPSFSNLSDLGTSASFASISTSTTTPSFASISSNITSPSFSSLSNVGTSPSHTSIASNLTSPSYSSLSTFASPSFSSLSDLGTSASSASILTSTTTSSFANMSCNIKSPSISNFSNFGASPPIICISSNLASPLFPALSSNNEADVSFS